MPSAGRTDLRKPSPSPGAITSLPWPVPSVSAALEFALRASSSAALSLSSSRRVPVLEPITKAPSWVATSLALPVAVPVAGLMPSAPATTAGRVPVVLAVIVQAPLVFVQFSAPVSAMM